jgi:hypothetical protein
MAEKTSKSISSLLGTGGNKKKLPLKKQEGDVIVTQCSLTLVYVFCRLDRKKKRKIFDWARHHRDYIDEWEMFNKNVDDNNEPHTNRESSEDEDTTYDHSTRVGRQVGAGPILDRVVCHLLYFSISICVTMNYNFELCYRATPLGFRWKK